MLGRISKIFINKTFWFIIVSAIIIPLFVVNFHWQNKTKDGQNWFFENTSVNFILVKKKPLSNRTNVKILFLPFLPWYFIRNACLPKTFTATVDKRYIMLEVNFNQQVRKGWLSGRKVHREFIIALAEIKKAAAITNYNDIVTNI